MTNISQRERLLGGLWGSLVGDALGVPVEFIARDTVQANPVTSMREYGTHHQPQGTWSDDGAMALCTADSLVNHEFNLEDLGQRFVRWMNDGLWTANGDVFDIGPTTSTALLNITKGTPAADAGGQHVDAYLAGRIAVRSRITGIVRQPLGGRFGDYPRARAVAAGVCILWFGGAACSKRQRAAPSC